MGLLPGLIISGGCLALLLWNVDWSGLLAALKGANYWWLSASLVSLLLAMGFKVLKWQQLLAPVRDCSRLKLFYSIFVGYLINTVLPGRLGEVARAYLLARLEHIGLAVVLSSVAVDRVLDITVLALMLGGVLPLIDLPEWVAASGIGMGSVGLLLLLLCVLLAMPSGNGFFFAMLDAIPRFPGKPVLRKLAAELILGVAGLKGVRQFVAVSFTSVGIWLATALSFYFGQLAFHIQAPMESALLVTSLTSLGMVVPSSPSYLGVFHYLTVLAMVAYGVDKEVALGFAIVMHLQQTLLRGTLGAFSLWRCGLTLMSWRELPV
ncbi:MAG TPA: lysylphosphatidylglycerol synthase transmembrane domain-containing protein, partial [Chloroflexota bacterium]|nr:lysylphosphatidylglycerol synthase transmembrane domain-containing protein [Chloroflexota bacterium]